MMHLAYVKPLFVVLLSLPLTAALAGPCRVGQTSGPDPFCGFLPAGSADLDLETPAAKPSYPNSNSPPGFTPAKAAPGIVVMPFAVQTIDNGVSMRSSIDSLRDYNAQLTSLKTDSLKALAPANLPAPKPAVAATSPLDLWTKLEVQGGEGPGEAATRVGLGADYKLGRSITVGMAAEWGDLKAAGLGGTQTYDKLDAHIQLKGLSFLSVDGRTNLRSGNADYAAANGAAEKRTLSVEPRLGQSLAIGNGSSIEPFVSYRREVDFEKQMQDQVNRSTFATQSVGAGVTLTKPDAYALSFTTDIGGTEGTQGSTVSSRAQLKLPLP